MALNVESTGIKAKVPDFKKRGKTKKGKTRPRVGTYFPEDQSIKEEKDLSLEIDLGPSEIEISTFQDKKIEQTSKPKPKKTEIKRNSLPKLKGTAFTESDETNFFKRIVGKLGPVNSMYYLILKSAVDKQHKGTFQASKNDIAKLLGISVSRVSQILRALTVKKAIEVIELENSTTQTAKKYRLNL